MATKTPIAPSQQQRDASLVRRSVSQLTPASDERIQELMRTEVAFIPNEGFSLRGNEDEGFAGEAGDHRLIAEIERGDFVVDSGSKSGLPSHLASMCATPLLGPDEERALFRRMNYLKFRGNALRVRLGESPELADEVEDCLNRAELLRNHLIQANTRLVMSIARRFADARNAFDDLLSQGIASLVHAVEKFDFERGYRFSTYATCAVRRDLYRLVMCRKRDL